MNTMTLAKFVWVLLVLRRFRAASPRVVIRASSARLFEIGGKAAQFGGEDELVRDMMEWFAGREDFPPPDERTVRRKVSAIWRELVSASP